MSEEKNAQSVWTRTSARSRKELTTGQEKAIRSLLRRALVAVEDVIRQDQVVGTQAPNDGQRDLRIRARPANVFCIDGTRGAGKTYALLSMLNVVTAISPPRGYGGSMEAEWAEFLLEDGSPTRSVSDRLNAKRRLAHTIKPVIPEDFEGRDTVMEAVIQAIAEDLEGAIKVSKEGTESQRSALPRLERLKKDLTENIRRGWIFVKEFGIEAVYRDALDYKDMVKHYSAEAAHANRRLEDWFKFIDEYLTVVDAHTLWVFLDDSDVSASVSEQILAAIRSFLNHERIVIVLAGSLISLRDAILQERLKGLGDAISALNKEGHPSGAAWRASLRQEVEEYVDKVLPPSKRFFLQPPELVLSLNMRRDGAGNGPPQEAEEFQTLTGDSWTSFLLGQLDAARPAFIDAKYGIARAQGALGMEPLTDETLADLERFMAWWLFTYWFLPALAPRSIRHLREFRSHFAPRVAGSPPTLSERGFDGAVTRKRLPVVLFRDPANYSIAQRFRDSDNKVLDWLPRQPIESRWKGRRAIVINEAEHHEGTYPYEFIRFRFDLAVSIPIIQNPEFQVPERILPRFVGRRRAPRFFAPSALPNNPRRLGIGKSLDHAAVPGNCIYLSHLTCLPDVAFEQDSQPKSEPVMVSDERMQTWGGKWERDLHRTWPNFVAGGQASDLMVFFTDVMLERIYGKEFTTAELIEARYSLATSTTQCAFETIKIELDLLKESYPVDATAGIRARVQRVNAVVRAISADDREGSSDENPPIKVDRDRARALVGAYNSIISEWRRGWHALRIFESSPDVAIDPKKSVRVRTDFALNLRTDNSDRYDLLTLDRILSGIKRSPWARGLLESLQDQPDNDQRSGSKPGEPTDGPVTGRPEAGASAKPGKSDKRSPDRMAAWLAQLDNRVTIDSKSRHYEVFIKNHDIWGRDKDYQVVLNEQNPAIAYRHVRELVLALYGIAPSLPSIIYMEVMSKVYLEVRRTLLGQGSSLTAPDREILNIQQRIAEEKIPGLRAIIDQLATLTRVARIAMTKRDMDHILAKTIAEMEAEESKPGAKEVREDRWRLFVNQKPMAEVGGEAFGTTEQRLEWLGNYIAQVKKSELGDKGSLGKTVRADFIAAPDIAPDTLHGDLWTSKYLAARMRAGDTDSDKTKDSWEPEYSKLSDSGIFHETEAALWAASDFLDILNACLVPAQDGSPAKASDGNMSAGEGPDSGSVPPPTAPKRARKPPIQ